MEITQNEITFISGESGAGKTTLLKLLCGYLLPDGGKIIYRGKSTDEYPGVLLRRCVLLQRQMSEAFEGTIAENINLGAYYQERKPFSEREIMDMLKTVALKKEPEDCAANLSGGELQRLAMARSLLLAPDVLLLDEPTASLDASAAFDLLEAALHYMAKFEITPIIISHTKELVQAFAQNVITLVKGVPYDD